MRLILTAALAAALAGCYSTSGETVLKYDTGGPAHLMRAPDDGRYALLKTGSTDKPQVVELRRGDLLGFRKYQDGSVAAVAGERQITIQADQSYRWRRE